MIGREFKLQTARGGFSGLAWPNPDTPRMLCLHGWLDNAASFLPLAPYLAQYDLRALDFAGHGHSDHRPAGTRYYMMDNLWDVDVVLEALEWEDCILVGHSLGGVVACTYAAAAPERVSRLVSLDGLGALSAGPEVTAKRLKASLASTRKASSTLKDYADVESAAGARQQASGLPFDLARILSERSLNEEGGVYRWRTDPALNWRSPSLMTEDQVMDILAAIEAPTLSVTTNPPPDWIDEDMVRGRLDAVPDCINKVIEGHHHFHMDQPALTAGFIMDFLDAAED